MTSTVSESVSEATSTSHGADRPGALARPLLERYSLERVDAGLAIGSELCRRLPGPGGVRAAPAPKGSPAPTKQAVARVATSGYSNPETALRLADSVKRVESHLTHPYAKLGISSRRELAVLRRVADSKQLGDGVSEHVSLANLAPVPKAVLCYYGLAQIVPNPGYSTRTIMGRGVLDRGGPRGAALKWVIRRPRVGQQSGPKFREVPQGQGGFKAPNVATSGPPR